MSSHTRGMTPREIQRRAQSLGLSIADYMALSPAQARQGASEVGTRISDRRFGSTGTDLGSLWADLLGDSGGGGAGYRPQTAEEAAALRAQTALATAQAADIPLARELARRGMLADVGVRQAERAANPRRIFESLYAQARLKMPEMAKGLQEKMNIPGFKEGKSVEGPVVTRVGEEDEEYALLMPGSVIAKKPPGEKPTMANAKRAIFAEMAEGGTVSPEKAAEMLRHGEVRGKPLSKKQRGLFALIASGKKLHSAQEGLEAFGLPPELIEIFERLRTEGTASTIGALRGATGGGSLYDALGGSTLTDPQSSYLGGLTARDLGKLSPTQRAAMESTLSANRVAPEDYLELKRREHVGFNPVATGTRALFSGILGRR